jgi:hypothetical protein
MRRLAFQETRIRPRALVGAQPKPSAGAAPSEINHPAGTTRVQDANLFDTLTGGGHWLEVVRLVAPLELIKLVTCIVTGALRETAAGCPMGDAASTAKIRNAIDIRYSFSWYETARYRYLGPNKSGPLSSLSMLSMEAAHDSSGSPSRRRN